MRAARFITWFVLLLPCAAVAQEPSSPDTLYLPQVVIAGNEAVAAPYHVTRPDSATMAAMATRTLADALAVSSAAYVRSYGQGSLATLSFRGTGANHTQLYWNGMPLNSPLLGLSDLAEMPMAIADRIELHHGLSSLADGSGGLGGSVYLEGSAQWQPSTSVSLLQRVASFNDYRTQLAVSHGNGRWYSQTQAFQTTAQNDFEFTNVAVQNEPIQRQQHARLMQRGIQQQLYRNQGRHTFSVRAHATETDRELPRLITAETSEQTQQDQAVRALVEWLFQSSEKTDLRVRSGYVYHYQHYNDPLASIADSYHEHGWYSNARLRFRPLTAWKFQANLESGIIRGRSTGIGGTVQRNQFAALLQSQWQPTKRWLVHLLLRQEVLDGQAQPTLPSLGITYSPGLNPRVSFRGSIARSFRYPTLNDLYWAQGGNPTLQPERGWSSELGLQTSGKRKQFLWEFAATAFYSEIDDWIQWVPQAGSNLWQATNYQHVTNQGVETTLQLSANVGGFTLQSLTSYTYTHNNVSQPESESTAAAQLIYVPAHNLSTRLVAKRKRYAAEYSHTFTDRVYITTDNQWYMPAWNTASLHLTAALTKRNRAGAWYARAEINNLFNYNYQVLPWRPMPGRWFALSLQYKWQKTR